MGNKQVKLPLDYIQFPNTKPDDPQVQVDPFNQIKLVFQGLQADKVLFYKDDYEINQAVNPYVTVGQHICIKIKNPNGFTTNGNNIYPEINISVLCLSQQNKQVYSLEDIKDIGILVENFQEYKIKVKTENFQPYESYLLQVTIVDLKTRSRKMDISQVFIVLDKTDDPRLEIYHCEDKTIVMNHIQTIQRNGLECSDILMNDLEKFQIQPPYSTTFGNMLFVTLKNIKGLVGENELSFDSIHLGFSYIIVDQQGLTIHYQDDCFDEQFPKKKKQNEIQPEQESNQFLVDESSHMDQPQLANSKLINPNTMGNSAAVQNVLIKDDNENFIIDEHPNLENLTLYMLIEYKQYKPNQYMWVLGRLWDKKGYGQLGFKFCCKSEKYAIIAAKLIKIQAGEQYMVGKFQGIRGFVAGVVFEVFLTNEMASALKGVGYLLEIKLIYDEEFSSDHEQVHFQKYNVVRIRISNEMRNTCWILHEFKVL